jgi:hypothetical protein
MIVAELSPPPGERVRFSLRFRKFVPRSDGCYALASFDDEVLYVGLTDNLHRRFREHRETREKRDATPLGAAFWFYYLTSVSSEVARIERTWMNQHLQVHGTLPVLNRIYSPVS